MTSVLSDQLTHGITLSVSGAYTAPFTITQTGTITGAVYSNLSGPASPFLENHGFDESVVFTNGGTVQNTGTISNAGLGYGILMRSGPGTVTNAQNAVIYGGNYGVAILQGPGLVTNAGSIGGLAGAAVEIAAGTITNQAGAVLYAHDFGVKILNPGGTIQNAGTIAGNQYGAFINGGAVTNTGTIAGELGALFDFSADATITNSGSLLQENSFFGTGVKLYGGTLVNTGFIYGATGLYLANAGTVFNAGTIAAFRNAVDFAGSQSSRLIVAPGAAFLGDVMATAATGNTLELTAGKSTLSGIGNKFFGFGTIAFDAGAAWQVAGLASGFGGDEITGFTTADALDLSGFSLAGTTDFTLSPGYVLSLPSLTLTFSATNAGETFALTADGHGGDLLTAFTGPPPNNTTSSSPITLQSGGTTTITGSINTYGVAGTYTIQSGGGTYTTTTVGAGVIDNGGTTTTVTNTSTIQSNGGSPYDAGILLTGPSTLINAGTIIAASGISVMGNTPGAYIESTNNICATLGTGIYLQQYGSALNMGGISAATTGILLAHGGYAYNSGSITAHTGICATGPNSYVYNSGKITATGDGIDLPAAGFAINAGSITAGGNGIYAGGGGAAYNSNGTAYNYGAITATTGILLTGPGAYAYNTGKIFSTGEGIYLTAPGIASNTGAIQSAGTGIKLAAGGIAYNYGFISAAIGISVTDGGTIAEYGTLIGTNFAASFATNPTNRFVINPSSTIEGEVSGGAGVLELAASTATGTIALSQFENFSLIQADAKSKWDLSGTFATTAALDNNGVVKLTKTALGDFEGAVTGTGTIALGAKPLTFASSVAASQKIDFAGAHETLSLSDPTAFAATIGNFTTADTIDITGLSLSAVTGTAFAGNVLTIAEAGAAIDLTFASTSNFGSDTFLLTQQGNGFTITLESAAKKMSLLKPPATPTSAAVLAIPTLTPTTLPHPTPTYITPTAAPGLISTFLTPTTTAPILITLQS